MSAIAKSAIRNKFSFIRATLPVYRRVSAEQNVTKIAQKNFPNVLSFASKPEEINLWLLNQILADQKRLLLPKVHGKDLLIYEVTDLKAQLMKGRFKILEPIPDRCKLIDINEISYVLVPGLAFDIYNRVGHGGGYFDRLLCKITCPKIGIGFQEQFSPEPLPAGKYDVPLDGLFLC